MTHPEPVNCYRCGQPGYTNWCDISTIADREPRYWPGEQYCLTDGCTDLDGSRRLVAPTPEEMRNRADAAWMARQRQLTEGPMTAFRRGFAAGWRYRPWLFRGIGVLIGLGVGWLIFR